MRIKSGLLIGFCKDSLLPGEGLDGHVPALPRLKKGFKLVVVVSYCLNSVKNNILNLPLTRRIIQLGHLGVAVGHNKLCGAYAYQRYLARAEGRPDIYS